MNPDQNACTGATLGNNAGFATKRPTLREELENNVKRAVDAAAHAQKALMTLPVAVLDADADMLAKSGIYFNCGYPF